MDDDSIGFTFFLKISFKQHERDFPHDKITFHDFSSICLKNWEVGVNCTAFNEFKSIFKPNSIRSPNRN